MKINVSAFCDFTDYIRHVVKDMALANVTSNDKDVI